MWLALLAMGIGLAALVDWSGGDDSDADESEAEPVTEPDLDATLIEGTAGDDAFGDIPYGSEGADIFDLAGGNDEAYGNGGDDLFQMGSGDDFVNGGFGDDMAFGDNGQDRLFGAPGDDDLFGGVGQDELIGGVGDDMLQGGLGDDELFGGADDDLLVGGADDDVLNGGAGEDTLRGGDGDDVLDGALALTGRETEEVDPTTAPIDMDSDVLEGGPGEDLMVFGPGDTVSGGVDEDFYIGFVTDPWPGHATITDMEEGAELTLDITRVTDTPDADAVTFTAQGTDTMVAYDGVDVVLLQNIAEGQFTLNLLSDGVGVSV